jgi:phospholipid/cholesterol/gamma-HCH transport system substrate-binding protein
MRIPNLRVKFLGVSLIGVGALIVLIYFYTAAGGHLRIGEGSAYKFSAVTQPQQILKHADVRSAGVKVGSVSNVTNRVTPNGTLAVIEMETDDNFSPIYRDATVTVRQKTLVGENYIDITRGTPQAGELPRKATLPLSHDQEVAPVDKILNALDAPTRKQISHNLQVLGAGLKGRSKDVNKFLGAMQPTLADGGVVMGILGDQKDKVGALVQQTGTVMQSIADRTSDMRGLIRDAKTTAEAVDRRDSALAAGLDELPATLRQARGSVAKLSGFATRATPVVGDLRVTLGDLSPVFKKLEPTAVSTRKLVDELTPLLKVADPMLTRLRRFSDGSAPTIPSLDAALRQVTPALAYLKPYDRDLGSALANFGDSLAYGPLGGEQSCGCPVSDRSFSNWTPAMRAAVAVLLDQGILAKFNHVDNNPVRKPGRLPNAGEPFTGTYPRVTAGK